VRDFRRRAEQLERDLEAAGSSRRDREGHRRHGHSHRHGHSGSGRHRH
jgi:hypothetical protein